MVSVVKATVSAPMVGFGYVPIRSPPAVPVGEAPSAVVAVAALPLNDTPVTTPESSTWNAPVEPTVKRAVAFVVPMPTLPAVVTNAWPDEGLRVNVPVMVSLETLTKFVFASSSL